MYILAGTYIKLLSHIHNGQIGGTLSISEQQTSANVGYHVHHNEHHSPQPRNIVTAISTKETRERKLIAERESVSVKAIPY